nr:UPF0489 family protein [uncultured Methylophaga sp.]
MTWIVPFEQRDHSGQQNQIFLYQNKNIYVMDNHRAALWCWLNHYVTGLQGVSIFHLDRHSDALKHGLKEAINQATSPTHLNTMQIDTYLNKADKNHPSVKLFRWDNYLSIFLKMYKDQINECCFSIYQGDEIKHKNLSEKKPWEIPENFSTWLSSGKWIINIDLDYFFYEYEGSIKKMYSDDYIKTFFSEVAIVAHRENEVVVTICFSPECCGGWEHAEEIWDIAESYLKTGMVLVPTV